MRKHWRYLSYVVRHKAFVFYAGMLIGPPRRSRWSVVPLRFWKRPYSLRLRVLYGWIRERVRYVAWWPLRGWDCVRWWVQLAAHDWSKFLPTEWGPYVVRFYGPEPEPYRPTLYYPGAYGGIASVLPDEIIPDRMVHAAMDGLSEAWTPELVRQVLERSRRARKPEATEVVDPVTGATARVTPEAERAFRVAWAKHIHRNPHHWQHWLLTLDEPRTSDAAPYDHRADAQRVRIRMPERYLREMVADWAGACRAITGSWDVVDWYEKNQGNIKIHGETRWAVEALLGQFEDEDQRTLREMEIEREGQLLGTALWEKGNYA